MKFNNKKLISGIIVTTLLVSCSTAFAAGTQGKGGNGMSQASKQNVSSSTNNQGHISAKSASSWRDGTVNNQKGNCSQRGRKLVKIAGYLSIDTTGLKPAEIVASITTAVKALSSTNLATLAGKLDIATTNKTDAEIVSAIEALLTPPAKDSHIRNIGCGKLAKIAGYLSIDTTGLKPAEIAASITAAIKALSSTDLATLAGKLDIVTTSKTDAEIVSAIEALLTYSHATGSCLK